MLLTLTRSASAWALCAMISIKQRSADVFCPSSMAAGKNKKKRRLRILDADSGKKKRRIGVSSGIGNHGGNESVPAEMAVRRRLCRIEIIIVEKNTKIKEI